MRISLRNRLHEQARESCNMDTNEYNSDEEIGSPRRNLSDVEKNDFKEEESGEEDLSHLNSASSNSTESISSFQSDSSTLPEARDAIEEVWSELQLARANPRPRDGIRSFVEWQLRSVSKQSAYYKGIHLQLKKRIRKRATVAITRDKLEDEALRIARLSPLTDDGKGMEAKEGDWEGRFLRADLMRMPLEAYLPRRITKHRIVTNPSAIEANLVKPSDLIKE